MPSHGTGDQCDHVCRFTGTIHLHGWVTALLGSSHACVWPGIDGQCDRALKAKSALISSAVITLENSVSLRTRGKDRKSYCRPALMAASFTLYLSQF